MADRDQQLLTSDILAAAALASVDWHKRCAGHPDDSTAERCHTISDEYTCIYVYE
jgi:hypothetical protein